MDILRILQTIGICLGALALTAIAIMLFLVLVSFLPSVSEPDEDEPLRVLRGKSRNDLQDLFTTPVDQTQPRHRGRAKKARPSDDIK
jgi:hypothetical protein